MEAPTEGDPSLKKKISNEKLSCLWSIVLIAFISGVVGFASIAFIRLPEDLPFSADPEEFIGFKAKYYLSELVSVGPRVVGSIANEVATVDFLLREIETLKLESKNLYNIETDVQVVSGKFINYGYLHVYESVQNVIVKLTPKNSAHTNALLINSHYDSVPTSPGAGDAGSMIAIMLGVLNSLTKSKKAVQHPIIFLLNGDEEKGLHAAHGFITKHKWAKDVRTLINLDAGGIGGKEIIIQHGPNNTRLLDYYNKAARHPHGQVLAEEIFQTPSFPSGTDFSVFRDYGKLTGLDMVFISNGFAYHTYMDSYSNLDDGSLQHAGDNVLSLVRTLANSEELDENFVPEPTGRGVYFDILGLIFVNYSENMGIAINSVIAILSLLVIGASIWVISKNAETTFCRTEMYFFMILIIQVASVGIGVSAVLGLAYLLDYINYTLSWYSQQWIMFGLYCCPFLFITGMIPAIFLQSRFFKRLPLRFNVMLLQHAQCVIFIGLIFYLTFLQYRSTFLVSYTVMFYTLSMMINLTPSLQKSAHLWIIPVVICQAIPLLLNSYIMNIIYTLIVPLTGRMPGNPDMYLAQYILGASIILMGFNIPLFNMFRGTKSILSIFLVVFIVDIILVFTPIGFPYSETTPQRHIVFHTSRANHDINGEITRLDPVFGVLLYDRHVEDTIQDIASKTNLKYLAEDEKEGLDFFNNMFGVVTGYELEIPNRTKLTLLSKEPYSINTQSYRYTFQADGDAKTLLITISSHGSSSLVDWTFRVGDESVPQTTMTANIQFGKSSPPYTFWVDVKLRDPSTNALSIKLLSTYLDDNDEYSDGLKRFFKLFPNWSVQMGYISSYDFYEF